MKKPGVILLLSVLGVVNTWVFNGDENEEKAQLLRSLLPKNTEYRIQNDVQPVAAFKWSSCGKSTDLAGVRSLSVLPDPLHIPGNVTFTFAFTVKKTLSSPLKATMSLHKKIGFIWVKVPCHYIGTCDYNDLCGMLGAITKLNSGHLSVCPIAPGNYSLPAITVPVTGTTFLNIKKKGSYRAQVKVTHHNQEVLCLVMNANIA